MQNDCKNCIHLNVCAYVMPDIPTCDSFLSKDILDKIIADGLPVSLDDKETGKQTGFMTDCGWIESLPYSEMITGGAAFLNKKITIPEADAIAACALSKLQKIGNSPDKSKAILMEFYEKMRKGDTSDAKPE